ncbi:MAG: DUF2891 domain-containing protein [Gemmataceae bacterium]|nr:DUF2891 domain-containing protein [Gemmataceae bacterium]
MLRLAGWILIYLLGLQSVANADEKLLKNPQPLKMTQAQGSAFARLALKGIATEFPNKPGNVLAGPKDVLSPRQLYPAFYGCFDWHSAVHGHWMLVRLLKQFPQLPEAGEIRAALAANLTAKNLLAEAAFFKRPDSKSFERPYGWSWLLKLAMELGDWDDAQGKQWRANLNPLVEVITARYVEFFPKQTYPIRSGVHSNTAFGLTFALDFARQEKQQKLEQLLVETARRYYLKDRDIPAKWEPDGADFFSPSLMEADLMRKVLSSKEYPSWLENFYPKLAQGEPAALMQPATVTDRGDPQIVHLDGLNLSRAWCMRNLARALTKEHPARQGLIQAAERHLQAGVAHVSSGDYAGEHWLASFAVLMYSTPAPE